MAQQFTSGPWMHLGQGDIVQQSSITQTHVVDVASVYCTRDGSTGDANARLIATSPELLAELQAAHLIIRNALAVMTTAQKSEWGRLNAAAQVDGEGITRANERAAVIAKARQ